MTQNLVSGALALIWLAGGGSALARGSCEEWRASLKSPNARTREAAVAGLAKAHCQDTVTPLAALVRDEDTSVRQAVAKALREARDPAAVPALTTLLGDGLPAIRSEAVEGLVGVYSERERPPATERLLGAFSDTIDTYRVPSDVRIDPQIVSALAVLLRDDSANVRKEAAVALGVLRGEAALPQLKTALSDTQSDVRAEVVTAIEKLGVHSEGRTLIPLLSDESSAVRARALHAMATLEVKESGKALGQMWEANRRRDWEPRLLEPLTRVRDPGLRDLFLSLVQDSDPERRRFGIEGLARVSDASLLPALKKDYQREGSEDLRLAYCFAITLLGDRVFIDSLVLALPHGAAGRRCHDYLVELGPTFLPDLLPYLEDPSADVRAALVDVLADMETPQAMPAIERLLQDASGRVVDRATLAVARLKRLPTAVH
jgi:HEAT repeat protein